MRSKIGADFFGAGVFDRLWEENASASQTRIRTCSIPRSILGEQTSSKKNQQTVFHSYLYFRWLYMQLQQKCRGKTSMHCSRYTDTPLKYTRNTLVKRELYSFQTVASKYLFIRPSLKTEEFYSEYVVAVL